MSAPVRTGELTIDDRRRVEEILVATGVFRDAEVEVALELFDETFPASIHRAAAPTPVSTVTPPADTGSPAPTRHDTHAGSVADDGYRFVGAFGANDELIGYACYGSTPDADRTWDLYWIAVDPAAQGAGGGTTLLSEVERRVIGLEARMLVVETSSRSDYDPTRRFYLARGYEEAARVGDFYAPADDRIIFTKRFPPMPPEGRSHNE